MSSIDIKQDDILSHLQLEDFVQQSSATKMTHKNYGKSEDEELYTREKCAHSFPCKFIANL